MKPDFPAERSGNPNVDSAREKQIMHGGAVSVGVDQASNVVETQQTAKEGAAAVNNCGTAAPHSINAGFPPNTAGGFDGMHVGAQVTNTVLQSNGTVPAKAADNSINEANIHDIAQHGNFSPADKSEDVANEVKLYVRRIPPLMTSPELYQLFARFGEVKKIDLPFDYAARNRGYATLDYENRDDALCTIEVLKQLFLVPHHRLDINISLEETRLFATNIPRYLTYDEVENEFRKIFPNLVEIYFDSVKSSEAALQQFGSYFLESKTEAIASNKDNNQAIAQENVTDPNNVDGIAAEVATIALNADAEEIKSNDLDIRPSSSRASIQLMNTASPKENKKVQRNIKPVHKNPGYAFLHFRNKIDAQAAKRASGGRNPLRLKGDKIYVHWGFAENYAIYNMTNPTLFIPNFDEQMTRSDIYNFLITKIPEKSIKKVLKSQYYAFVEFTSHDAAANAKNCLNGLRLNQKKLLNVRWARNMRKPAFFKQQVKDYDGGLRLRCMANYWDLPIIVFGTYYPKQRLQHGSIIFRPYNNNIRAIYFMMCTDSPEIHERMCETACAIIDYLGSYPQYNYLVLVRGSKIDLLGNIMYDTNGCVLIGAHGVPATVFLDFNDIYDLALAVKMIAEKNMKEILNVYQQSLLKASPKAHIFDVINGHRYLAPIPPNYRNKPPLPYDLNDTQIVLSLNYIKSCNNLELRERPFCNYFMDYFRNAETEISFMRLNLKPIPTGRATLRFVTYDDPSIVEKILHPQEMHFCSYFTAVRHTEEVLKFYAQQMQPQSTAGTGEKDENMDGNIKEKTLPTI